MVTKFLAIKHTTKMASGENPDTYKERLLEDFRKKHNRPFNFYKYLEYLDNLPKFANHKDPSEVAQMEIEEECGVKTVVPDTVCPEGAKKAAKRQKMEAMAEKSKKDKKERVKKVVAAINSINETLKSKFEEDTYKLQLKDLTAERAFCFQNGDTDGAKKAHEELNALKNEFKAKKLAAAQKKWHLLSRKLPMLNFISLWKVMMMMTLLMMLLLCCRSK